MRLRNTPTPRLPDPPGQYAPTYLQALLNVLRLYFNGVSALLGRLVGPNGGQFVDCPNGLFFSTTDQPMGGVNTAQPVEFELTYLSNAVEVNAGTESRIYTQVGGVYNFQFSGQLRSSSASSKQVYIWIVRNGAPIGYTTHQYTIAGSNEHLEISWNFNIDMQEGWYLELEWAADSTDVVLETVAATAPHPGIPSAVMAVNFIAPLPDPLPTPP
jgi:hypothetical protein